MLDLRYLRYFIAVAEELNFTRAAERLNTVHPSLHQQIHRLEEIVGTPLLDRRGHHIELTKAGSVFLAHARTILRSAETGIELARQEARVAKGHLAVAFAPGSEPKIVPTVLTEFRTIHPEIHVSLRSIISMEQPAALINGFINLGVLAGKIQHPALESEVIARDRMVVVLPADHPLAALVRIPVRSLAAMPIVLPSPAKTLYIYDLFNSIAAQAGVSFHGEVEAENAFAMIVAVAAGCGLALVPEYLECYIPPTLVLRRLDHDPQPWLENNVVYRKDDKLPALTFFLNALRKCRDESQWLRRVADA